MNVNIPSTRTRCLSLILEIGFHTDTVKWDGFQFPASRVGGVEVSRVLGAGGGELLLGPKRFETFPTENNGKGDDGENNTHGHEDSGYDPDDALEDECAHPDENRTYKWHVGYNEGSKSEPPYVWRSKPTGANRFEYVNLGDDPPNQEEKW